MPPVGISGVLTRSFIRSPLTPLFLLAAIAVGVIALNNLAREEEPQISVHLVDIHLHLDGLKAGDAVELVTKPLEDIIKGVDGVEHVYSQTSDDSAVVTARFFVGTDSDTAILRVHEKINANLDRIPIGIPEPLIVGRGINDVPILVLPLAPKAGKNGHWNANRSFQLGQFRGADQSLPVAAGQTLEGVPDIGLLLLTTNDDVPVYVKDVANVVADGKPLDWRTWNIDKAADGGLDQRPMVSLALAKRTGANAVTIAEQIVERLALVGPTLLPDDVEVLVTRNYGETANEKADELLLHLAIATLSIVLLIGFALGWREAGVVLVVIPTTILLTLFASWLLGYTINRVSLFALIFSIGILVDDAIVMIENIVRHWAMDDKRDRYTAAIEAVAEVGNPTIFATLTVIAALLPMMFVSGLMGPYMSPIPANASAAMLFSFFVAVTITPWLLVRLSKREGSAGAHQVAHGGAFDHLHRRGRYCDDHVHAAVSDQVGGGEAAAIRQQIRATRSCWWTSSAICALPVRRCDSACWKRAPSASSRSYSPPPPP